MVVARPAAGVSRRQIDAIAAPGLLEFYDWEANALTPNGKTVASQLQSKDPTALAISQGGGSAPGLPGAGSMSLYRAVRLASKQPPAPTTPRLTRLGPQYYMFGAAGSTACAMAAKASNTAPVRSDHCLLAGPDAETNTVTREQAVQNLASQLPAGVSRSAGQVVAVPQGTVVLQAMSLSAANQVRPTSSAAQFYVLRDNASLSGNDITNPQPRRDQSGSPDVQFGFSSSGNREFEKVTAQIAKRGALVSGIGSIYEQHFAVALDSQLITVPSIDFKQYPDGIIGGDGADITGGLTTQSARTLASVLRYGPLSVNLTPQ